MLSSNSLLDLVSEVFDPDRMKEAVHEEILSLIAYEELAQEIVSDHESEISSLIAEMAEDALR